MAEVKWIKIVTDLFDDEKILLIDGLPEHDSILVIWFRMLCLAGKQNNGGVFLMNDKIPYTDEMLATIFHRPINTVRLALDVFRKFGMIEMMDDTITIPNWDKHQSLEAYERKKERDRLYQANRRAARLALLSGKSSDSRLTTDDSSSVVASPDKEEKEREKEKERETSPSASQPEEACPFRKIQELYHELCVSFPRIRSIEGERRKAVSARWRTHRSLDAFAELFRTAEESAFLKGQNDRNWHADFDWMMKASNFDKILEHKYDGNGPRGPNGWGTEDMSPAGYENMQPL